MKEKIAKRGRHVELELRKLEGQIASNRTEFFVFLTTYMNVIYYLRSNGQVVCVSCICAGDVNMLRNLIFQDKT